MDGMDRVHLEESGHYSVILQAWDFAPGSNFVVEMDRAIQDYVGSLFTNPEWAVYFARDPTTKQRRIIQYASASAK